MISKFTPIIPNGSKFGELKASISLVLSFVVLLPLSILLWKNSNTSGMLKCPAISKDPNKFSTASFLNSSMGIYDPVIITDLFKFSSINERPEAV